MQLRCAWKFGRDSCDIQEDSHSKDVKLFKKKKTTIIFSAPSKWKKVGNISSIKVLLLFHKSSKTILMEPCESSDIYWLTFCEEETDVQLRRWRHWRRRRHRCFHRHWRCRRRCLQRRLVGICRMADLDRIGVGIGISVGIGIGVGIGVGIGMEACLDFFLCHIQVNYF